MRFQIMKKLQMLLFVALIMFTYSCKDDVKTPVQPEDKTTIDLIAMNGTEITGTEVLSEVNFKTQIVNTGTNNIKVLALMKIIELKADQYSYFCWGDLAAGNGTCYIPTNEDFLSDFTVEVKAGETTPGGNFINYVINQNPDGGAIKIRYIVYEKENESNRDSIDYTITF